MFEEEPQQGDQPALVNAVLQSVEVAPGPASPEEEEVTFTCDLVPLPGYAVSAVLRVVGHDLTQYDGDYCYAGDSWGAQPHFQSASDLHFYHAFNAYWQLDDRVQDPDNIQDWANGGFLYHGGWYWNFYDYTDHYEYYPVYYKDGAGADQVALARVQYFEPAVEVEVNEEEQCTPLHESGDVLVVSGHPVTDWNGKYCRTEDWNDAAHYETWDGNHFHYAEL